MKLNLLYDNIENVDIRENFREIEDGLLNFTLDKAKFKFYEITLSGVLTNFKYKHNLNYKPKDVILLSVTGVGNITFNYNNFDKTNIDLTTTGDCTVRFFLGHYRERSDA